MSNQLAQTALICLHSLVNNVKRNINFESLLTDEIKQKFIADPVATVMELAQTMDLGPELREMVNKEPIVAYQGPALARLTSGSWVCLVDASQMATADTMLVFDPTVQGPKKMVNVPTASFVEKWDGLIIIFKNLQPVDNSKHTALFTLASIGKHHGLDMDVRRLLHEYAVGEDEPNDRLIAKIASDYSLKIKNVKLDWDQLKKLGHAYPAIGIKKNGKFAILCGFRKTDEKGEEVVVVDPENKDAQGQHFLFWNQGKYEEEMEERGFLLKRIYSLISEEQPFGLRWFIPEFYKLRGIFGQIALSVLMINGIALITPLYFQIVVDKVLTNQSYNTLNVLGIGIMLALVLNAGLEFLRSYLLLFATNKIDISTATKTFRHLMRLPIDFFERVPSGVLLKHMQQTERIRGFLSGNLFFTFLETISLVVFIPFMMFYSFQLTMVVLGFSALMALVIALLIKPFQRRLHELYQAEGKRQSMLVEAIHGVRTVKSLAIEPVQEKIWNDSTAFAINSYFKVGKISMTAKTISQFLEMSMTVSIIWLGALAVFDNRLSVGALIAFQMLSGKVTGPLVRMVALIHEYQQIALSVRMLGAVMNTPQEPMGGGVRNPLKGKITFENVSFQYTPDTPQVIRNFSMDIPLGSTIGIVGRSGSGKTTLTKLLQGLYPVQQGLIKIDGIDLREIDKSHLRSSIGVVLQENYFFNGTVRDNISLTKKSASLEEIIYAAKLAGADEFVQKLTKGYDTMLEENASNLSGGQKQRLAIARALLTNPSILIFDEATSALDPDSETVIQDNLKAIARNRTVIIISHRLSIVSDATQILVLDNGEKSDIGTHRELLSRPGIYKDFWSQQMERNLEK